MFSTKSIFATIPDIEISGFSETDPEYVELKNNSDTDINLDGWSIRDNNNLTTDDIYLTSSDTMESKSIKKFINSKDSTWLNNDGDVIYLYYGNDIVDSLSYPVSTPTSAPTEIPTPTLIPTSTPTRTPTSTPTITPTKTPTLTPTSTPTLTPTLTPTSTTKPTATPTINLNLYDSSGESTLSAIIEPASTANTPVEATPIPTIVPTSAQELILGETTTSKKNPLPLIFICIGALFLLTPLIIAKIKHGN